MSTQYARAASRASRAMIGRKTSGGFVITSSPPLPECCVSTAGDALGLEVGDGDPVGAADGDGEAGGVGVGAPCWVKVAHGGA
jgi:hypothetical protein